MCTIPHCIWSHLHCVYVLLLLVLPRGGGGGGGGGAANLPPIQSWTKRSPGLNRNPSGASLVPFSILTPMQMGLVIELTKVDS